MTNIIIITALVLEFLALVLIHDMSLLIFAMICIITFMFIMAVIASTRR